MDNPGEILRLCRLCLVKDQVNIPIFAEQGDSREIFLKISSCLPVKVSIEDRLPKKICDGCSEKLNSFYEFWSSSANAEKTLLSWLGEDEVEEKKVQAVPKSLTASATLVKEESAELVDEAHAESIEESTKDESEAPPTKRARRSAAVKAQINLAPDSEDDDLDTTEPLTKMEEESADSDGEEKDPSYTEMPGTSADDEQAGPSGMGKDGVEAPFGSSNFIKCRNVELMVVKKEEPTEEFKCLLCNCDMPPNDECDYICKLCRPKPIQFVANSGMFHQCKKCYLEFDRIEDLERHGRTCGKELSEDSNSEMDWKYVSKLKKRKVMTKSFKCLYCPKAFSRKNALNTHTKTHSNLHKCPKCATTFTLKKELKNHLKTHSEEYLCSFCGQAFPHIKTLKVHLRLHAGGGEFAQKTSLKKRHRKPFECTDCGKGFFFKHHLNRHTKSHTSQPGSYGCDYCLEHFKSRSLLIGHLTQCSVYQCWKCKGSFTTREDRDSHQCLLLVSVPKC